MRPSMAFVRSFWHFIELVCSIVISSYRSCKRARVQSSPLECMEDEDLLTEILVRLPPESLTRFKSVSKTWLRLISCTQLRRRNSQRLSKEISSLLQVPIYSLDSQPYCDCEFLALGEDGVPRNPLLERLDFVPDQGRLEVISHCNGLLLCSTRFMLDMPATEGVDHHMCYVFNPTTKEYATVSVDRTLKLGDEYALLYTVNLAFDPRKSLHYKLIFVYKLFDDYIALQIYSSDTSVKGEALKPVPTRTRLVTDFNNGVYWNGAVNWPSYHNNGVYFNVEEEQFGLLPMLPVPEDVGNEIGFYQRYVVYFGESNDRLHLIEHYSKLSSHPTLQFDVYELDRGYSEWFLRFRVDLQPLYGSLPLHIDSFIDMPGRFVALSINNQFSHFISMPKGFGVMSVVRKDDDEESFLVVSIPGAVFRYHFKDGSFKKIGTIEMQKLYDWMDSISFIQSLYHP